MLAVLFLTFLDTTIVSVTLGDIQYDLGAGVIPLQWVINAYSLVFASLMLVGGSLADRFGPQVGDARSASRSSAAARCCARWPRASALVIAGRAVMGIGAAASEPGTLSVIRQLYPDRGAAGPRARARGRRCPGSRSRSARSSAACSSAPAAGGAVFWFNLVARRACCSSRRAAFVPEQPRPAARARRRRRLRARHARRWAA